MVSVSTFAINPVSQLKKTRDSTRRSELQEMRRAFDAYFHDTGCFFPQGEEIPWGQEWIVSGETMLRKVPTGPGNSCSDASCSQYSYFTDESACPQWFIIFAEKEYVNNDISSNDCFIDTYDNSCFPTDFEAGKYICAGDGIMSCEELRVLDIPTISE
jgi:hypothetical protein